MITEAVLTVLFGILNSVFDLIPGFTLFNEIAGERGADGALVDGGVLGDVIAALQTFDLFMPVTTIFLCISAIIGVKVFMALGQFVRWLWAAIPGKGS